MKKECSMCGNAFYDAPSDILPGKLVCSRCEAYVRSFAKGKNEIEKRSAEVYVRGCLGTALDDETRTAIRALLLKYGQDEEPQEVAAARANAETENVQYDPAMRDYLQAPSVYSVASGKLLRYVVIQVSLHEKLMGTGSDNLLDLENVINHYAELGYRLHTMSTTCSESKGLAGGERIQATLVFERI